MRRIGFALASALLAAPATAQIQTARVTGGTVSGVVQDGAAIYKGIPFAAPPLGDLRWRWPYPVQPWSGTLAADHFGQACSQNPRMLAAFGDKNGVGEDCLTLNVWTPAKTPAEKLPVMVWIYGGGFQGGTASLPLYDGAGFAKRGVVFVSINYRTGAIGMLAHPELSKEEGGRSGNYGLMDILWALKWVRANIAQFGGDDHNVTIFGQSGGAEAVGMLSYTPAAKGLYDKAISESGGNMKPYHRWETDYSLNQMRLPDAEQHGVEYLDKLGVKTIAEARALPADVVTAKMPEAHGPFWPDFDGLIQPGDNPVYMFENGLFNDVPILVGTNSDDGGGSAQPSTPEKFDAWAHTTFGGGADAILAAYPHATNEEASRSSDNIFRDNEYAWSTYQWARLQAEKGKAPVYTYYFDRKTARTPNGARHGAEVGLVLGRATTPEDKALSDQLMSYWINFAKTGNPNGAGLPLWPRFTAKDQRYMGLGDKTGPIAVPNKAQLDALSAYYAWRKAQK